METIQIISEYAEIGSRIKEIRKKIGNTQSDFASLIGVKTKAIISNWEKGRHYPSPMQLYIIARLGNKTTDWLISGEEKEIDDSQETASFLQRIKDIGIKTEKEFNAVFPKGKYMMDVNKYIEIAEKNKKKQC